MVTNGLSLVRAGVATAKVVGFQEGGRTGASAGRDLLDLNRLTVSGTGELLDQDGFAVAGIVHKNEYVIPEWMRQDPKVVQVEEWLEAKCLRGYAGGGATSDGGSQASPVESGGLNSSEAVELLRQLLAEQRLQREEMNTWARELTVVQNLYELDQAQTTYKKVNQENGIQ